MLRHLKNKKGITLVELILSLILLLIVLSLGYLIFSVLSGNFSTGASQSFVQQNARFVDDFFKDNIRNIGQLYIGENQSGDMEYALFLEDDIAKTNERDITEAIISDIRVKVDRSGTMAVLNYIINGVEDGKTFEISNHLVLNNIPAEYLPEDYDNYISLKTNKLSYNYDPIYMMTKAIMVYPPVVTTGQTYTEEEPLKLNLVISNDIFVDGVSRTDFELDFPNTLNIIDVKVYKENDNLVILTLTGNTGSVEVNGEILVRASGLAGEDDVSAVVPFETPEVAYLTIKGAANLPIPLEPTGFVTTEKYTVVIFDQGGNEMPDEVFTWGGDVVDNPIDGVSGDLVDDSLILTVSSEAEAGFIIISANWSGDPDDPDDDIGWELKIDLEKTTLADIMYAISALPFKPGFSELSSPSYLVTPSIGGIFFTYTESDGTGISINPEGDEVTLVRKNNLLRIGNVTLHGEMTVGETTETYDVVFHVLIPDEYAITTFPEID